MDNNINNNFYDNINNNFYINNNYSDNVNFNSNFNNNNYNYASNNNFNIQNSSKPYSISKNKNKIYELFEEIENDPRIDYMTPNELSDYTKIIKQNAESLIKANLIEFDDGNKKICENCPDCIPF